MENVNLDDFVPGLTIDGRPVTYRSYFTVSIHSRLRSISAGLAEVVEFLNKLGVSYEKK